jgi:hypothetical protein
LTGSFNRLRLQTDGNQATTSSDNNGNIRIFDFSQNNLHLSGYGFENNKNVFSNNFQISEELSPDFDLNTAKTKVRVRSVQDATLLANNPYAEVAPVYRVNPAEEIFDDTRFSIDMSAVKGLNQNILTVFSDFSAIDNALGKPNLLFSDRYQDLINLRKMYFENIISDLDLNRYREIFKWIDGTFTEMIAKMLPKSTNFLGINYIYESHVLERHKLSYLYDEIYLKALPRDPTRGDLFLSVYSGLVKKS